MSLTGSIMLSTSMLSTTSVISGKSLTQRFLQRPFLTTAKYSECKLIPKDTHYKNCSKAVDRKSNGLPNWYQDLETADARIRSHGSFKFKWLKTSMDMSRPRHWMKSCLFFPSDILTSIQESRVRYQTKLFINYCQTDLQTT